MQCSNASCSSGTSNIIDSYGYQPSLALASDDTARVFYSDQDGANVHFIECLDLSCSSTSTTVTIQARPGFYYNNPSIAVGAGGLARFVYITYNDSTQKNELNFAQCLTADCASFSAHKIDNQVENTQNASMVLGSDGFARIAYSVGGGQTSFVQCLNASCTSNSASTFNTFITGSLDNPSVALGSDGLPRILYSDGVQGAMKYMVC